MEVIWSFATPSDRQLSDAWGGPHGDPFDDVASLPADPSARRLALRTGRRVDRVELTLSNGYLFSHGGAGGTESALDLAADEYLSSATLCSGVHGGHTRVFYASRNEGIGQALTLSGQFRPPSRDGTDPEER